MNDTPEEPYVNRLPAEQQREFARHTHGIMKANQSLKDINTLAEMETLLVNDGGEAQLASFFRGNADNCRRNMQLWSEIADHFDGMARIAEGHG